MSGGRSSRRCQNRVGIASPCHYGGLTTDPNLIPANLVTLVKIGFNKAVCNPTIKAIMEKYYELFRGDNKGKAKTKAGSSTEPIEAEADSD